jgi:hypothetical protein
MNVIFHAQPARAQDILGSIPFHQWRVPNRNRAWCEFRHVANGIHLRFPDLADFTINEDGFEVDAIPVPGLDAASLEHLQLNQVLPLALSVQGIPVFHASGIELAGAAVAFVGESGRGKSTLATYMALHSAALITDDGLELEWRDDHYLVKRSHPSVRLWEDSQEALVGNRLPTAPAVSYTDKARFLAGQQLSLCDGPRPLRCTFFLGEGETDRITITRMSAAEAAMEWVKHSFLADVGDKQRLSTHFAEITRLAAQGISFRLDYPRRYDMLPAVADALRHHASREGWTATRD